MRATCWWRLLAKNRFRVTPSRLHVALGVSFFTPINDLLAATQEMAFGRRIRETKILKDPVFILGHWRSGTTLLHELLVSDPQFASPNTFQCFAPSHFLISEYLMVRFGNFLLPKKRPMDEMEAGWKLPQEDEFALMNLGVPSPYLRVAFPQTQERAMEYLNFQNLPEKDLAKWRDGFLWFLKVLTYHYESKQLILKSPPHTGRLGELAKLFPNAKFIHLTRDPRKLFSSTMRLWRSLDEVQALQPTLSDAEMKDYVIRSLQMMYEGYDEAKQQLPEDRLMQLRYEDLVASPKETMKRIYAQLSLGDFSNIEPTLDKRLEGHQAYRPNRHSMDEVLEQEILSSWSKYAEEYGYVTAEKS